ncbi:MAG TPA: hypothetical protein VGF99_05465 [Myxococcota bacterium]
MRIPALIAAAALLPTIGCLQETNYIDDTQTDSFFGGDAVELNDNVRDGIIDGRYGLDNSAVFDEAPVTSTNYYADGYGTESITLISERNGRMGMMIIDTYDGASLRTLPAGTYRSSSTMASQVSVLVCSNEFDAPADDANVVIEDQPDGTRTVTVEAITGADYGMDNSDNPARSDFTLTR